MLSHEDIRDHARALAEKLEDLIWAYTDANADSQDDVSLANVVLTCLYNLAVQHSREVGLSLDEAKQSFQRVFETQQQAKE